MTEQPQPQTEASEPVVYQAPQQAPRAYSPQPMLEADARMWSMLINLAAILGIILSGGMLSLAAVLAIWLIYRERSALVDFHGKQQLNLMITAAIVVVSYVVLGFLTFMIGFLVLGIPVLGYGIYLLVMSIIAAVAANKGEYYKIPLVIRLIK